MVMGMERGFQFLDSLPNVEGYFIYATGNGGFGVKKTKGFAEQSLK
jgi:hypothetical protein